MEPIWQDLRFAVRALTRRPGFAIFAVLTLAIGIGANTAIFSMVDAVLLRPLALREPDRVVSIWESRSDNDKFPISIPDFLDIRTRNGSFAQVAAIANWNANLSGESTPERVQGIQASGEFFEVLGTHAELGRTLQASDAQPGSPRVAVLSHGFWARHYGRDRAILGKSVRLNGDSYAVVGVLPSDFVYRQVQDEVITPLVFENDARREQRNNNFLRAYGRLKPGVSAGQARADLVQIVRRLEQEYPATNAGRSDVSVQPLQDSIVGNVRRSLMLLFAAVMAVLLIACANLAGLLLVRATTRRREIAIRVSLGATRGRLMRQLLAESLLMAAAGGALGVALAAAGHGALLSLSPSDLPRAKEIGLDARVLGFTGMISLACGFIFGLAPAWELSRINLNEQMKAGGRGSAGSMAHQRVRQLLVVAQVAVSLVLLVGSGLLLKSFVRLEQVSPGFEAKNLLVVRLALPKFRYAGSTEVMNFYRALSGQVENLPGVQSVAVANVIPTDGFLATVNFSIVGRGWPADQFPEAHYRMTTPRYFKTLKIPLINGREFEVSDEANRAPVAIISQTFARKYWADGNAVGAHVQIDDTQEGMREVEIVGIVGDVHDFGLDSDYRAEIYTPIAQVPGPTLAYLRNNMCWFVRTGNEPLGVAAAVREEVRKIDADVPATSTRTLEQYLAQAVAPRQFNLVVVGFFGVAALLLATLGIYAVISYSVAQRTGEIGLRIALGAQRGEVFRLITGQGIRVVATGVIAGIVPAMALTGLMKSMLFGVSVMDPQIYAGIVALLLVVALLACYLPGRRAMSVDPVTALRSE